MQAALSLQTRAHTRIHTVLLINKYTSIFFLQKCVCELMGNAIYMYVCMYNPPETAYIRIRARNLKWS